MISRMEGSRCRRARPARDGGFTLIETLVVLAIFGILAVIFYPSAQNAFELRGLDNAARDILTTMQMAKWQAVNSKYNHRVHFIGSALVGWTYQIEIERSSGTWTLEQSASVKRVPTNLSVTLTLPADESVIFDPTGFVSGFDSTKNVIALASSKLALLALASQDPEHPPEPSIRRIRFFASGSTQFIKACS